MFRASLKEELGCGVYFTFEIRLYIHQIEKNLVLKKLNNFICKTSNRSFLALYTLPKRVEILFKKYPQGSLRERTTFIKWLYCRNQIIEKS